MHLGGIEVCELPDIFNNRLWVQSRFPKSRKKRIRRKFAKKYGRWEVGKYMCAIDLGVYKLKFDSSDPVIRVGTRETLDRMEEARRALNTGYIPPFVLLNTKE